jgi:cytochrome P450
VTTFVTAAGRAPGIGHALGLLRGPLRFLQSLQRQGDLVRVDIGPLPTLFVTHPDLINTMLTDRHDLLDKGRFYDKVRPLTGNGIVLANGDEHRRQFAMIKPAFHREQIARYADVMRSAATSRVESWRAGTTIAVDREMKAITLNILAGTMFGSGVGAEAAAELNRLLPTVLQAIMWRTVSPTDLLERLPLPMNRRFDQAFADLRRTISEVMWAYRRDRSEHTDMLAMLIGATDPATGEPMTDAEVCNQIVSVTMAGSETAATAMAWMFYELARHPKIERRVRDEAFDVLGDRAFELADVAKLEYCHRVVQEVLRVRQPILVISRRAVRDFAIGGGTVRAGTELFYSPYAVHRDERWFADPLRFDPDRWLTVPQASLPRGAYTPFGAGPRHCVGEPFAWAMMAAVLTTVVRRWRLAAPDGLRVREMPWATINPDKLPMTVLPADGRPGPP